MPCGTKEEFHVKNSVQKRMISLLMMVILLLGGFSGLQEESGKEFTVMIYMCGSDLESSNSQATRCMTEILNTGYNADKINVVALAGGTRHWYAGYSTDELTLIELTGRRPKRVTSFPLNSMGAADTLTNFLNYCYEAYPAENYILDMWDHGGGPIVGVCADDLFDPDIMEMYEMVQALENSVFGQDGLDMILFHACLMASAEIMNMLSPYADYMVASQDSFYGFSYDWLKGMENDESIRDTAKKLIDDTYVRNEMIIEAQNAAEITSISLVDLKKSENLIAASDAYFAALTSALSEDSFTNISNARRNAVTFGITESGGSSNYDLVDLGDFVANSLSYAPAEAEALTQALNEAVLYVRSSVEGCSGLTVYHPFSNKYRLTYNLPIYNSLDYSAEYKSYVHNFVSLLTGTPLTQWTGLRTDIPEVTKDMRTLFTMSLNEEQTKYFADAQLEVLHKTDEGAYKQVFANPGCYLKENKLTSEFTGTALYAVDAQGKAASPAFSYSVSANGNYILSAVLEKDADENGEAVTHDALVYMAPDGESKKLVPGRVHVWNESMNTYTAAADASFSDYDRLTVPVVLREETRNDEGTLLPFDAWNEVKTESWTAEIGEDWHFALVNDTIDTAELYATFRVCDSQNNFYSSELAAVKSQSREKGEGSTTYDDLGLARISSFDVSVRDGGLLLAAGVVNLTEKETFITLEEICVNKAATGMTGEAFGSGPYWGLLKDEEQFILVNIPHSALEGQTTLTEITFNMIVTDAETEEVMGVIEVQVSLNMEV